MLSVAGFFYIFNANLRNTNKRKRIYQTKNIKKMPIRRADLTPKTGRMKETRSYDS